MAFIRFVGWLLGGCFWSVDWGNGDGNVSGNATKTRVEEWKGKGKRGKGGGRW